MINEFYKPTSFIVILNQSNYKTTSFQIDELIS